MSQESNLKFFRVEITSLETGDRVRNIKIPLFVLSLVSKYAPTSVYRLVQKHGDKSDAEAIKELVTVISNVIKDASDPESLLENGNLLAEIEEHGERIVITICE
jgi:hypothetical protein